MKSLTTTFKSSFINQGEVCVCGERIYVERSIYDEFVEKFAAKTRELIVGDPFDTQMTKGALVAKVHYDKVMSYFDIAKEEGATFVTGGKRPEGLDKGYFVEPTIITGLDDMCSLVLVKKSLDQLLQSFHLIQKKKYLINGKRYVVWD